MNNVMKLLTNEQEYRNWLMTDFYHLTDLDNDFIGEAEIEVEVARNRPQCFPCIACVLVSENVHEHGRPYFASLEEVHSWYEAMCNICRKNSV